MYSTLHGACYTAAPQRTPQGKLTGDLSIIKPGGTVYGLALLSAVCSCKAGQNGIPCKHRREAVRLSHDAYITFTEIGDLREAYSLALVWAHYVNRAENPFPDYLLPFLHRVLADIALRITEDEKKESFLLIRSLSGNTTRDNELPDVQEELDRLSRLSCTIQTAYDKLRNIAACPLAETPEGLRRAA